MQFRTDLALEAAGTGGCVSPDDCEKEIKVLGDITVTKLHLFGEQGVKEWGRPKGNYITLELPPLTDDETALKRAAAVLADNLQNLLPKTGTVLVAGLGNRAITPDALGPKTAGMVLATRHIQGEFAKSVGLSDLRSAAVLTTGVLGQTGTESAELIQGVAGVVHPAAIIAIDALAARSVHRLGCTVQLTDTGISPGAGVGNHRHPLNQETLGIPVIGIGIPTVIDGAVIAEECGASAEKLEQLLPEKMGLVVTPKEIDLLIARGARLLAAGIHLALHPDYDPLELISLAQE